MEPLRIQALLKQYNLHPDKSLGQNFLVSEFSLERIVQVAEVNKNDTVLEIGPGLGSLTRHLAKNCKTVIAVELDGRLLPALNNVLAHYTNIEIVQGDILEIDPARLTPVAGYIVVANIPYYITSAVIRHLVEARQRPKRMVLTVQLEVAQRICAQPGELSLLALSVQVFGASKIVHRIPSGAFYPKPNVDSAVIRIDFYPEPLVPLSKIGIFFRLAKAGFSQKRKMLRNALAAGMAWDKAKVDSLLRKADIDPQRRAQTLSLAEWHKLTDLMVTSGQL